MKFSFVAAVGAVLLGVTSARANFIVFYTGNVGTGNLGNVFNYTLRFTVDQPGEVLRSGDTVTLYDVAAPADIASVTAPTSPGGVFTVSQQGTGTTPASLAGAAGLLDSATRQNITFTYTGPDRTAPQDFTGSQIMMITSAFGWNLFTGKQAGSTEIGFQLSNGSSSQQMSSIRWVLLPATQGGVLGPEPGSLAVMGLGAAAMMVRRRRAGNVISGSRS